MPLFCMCGCWWLFWCNYIQPVYCLTYWVIPNTDYTLIAGIVILFNFMNTTMSGATSRFLTYELGTNDKCRLKATFETAFFLHIMISLVLLIVCETVGVWYVNNKW